MVLLSLVSMSTGDFVQVIGEGLPIVSPIISPDLRPQPNPRPLRPRDRRLVPFE
jgi:hypothetical protein